MRSEDYVLVDNVVHHHERYSAGKDTTHSKGTSVMDMHVVPGTEAKVNETLMTIANMKTSPGKDLLVNAIKACGGNYGEAVVMAQKIAVNEWTEQGYTNKSAIQRATDKYPDLFKP